MTAVIQKPDGSIGGYGTVREVTDLGWLLRHWKDVERFNAYALPRGDGMRLEAYLWDKRRYVVNFASGSIMRDWLNRPVFKNAKIVWEGVDCAVGNATYLTVKVSP